MPILIGTIYWQANRHFGGPAYQQDEIGYLVNAAFLAGYVVDGFSSYHAGYSIFLAPLFILLNGPDEVWKGVQVENALFWVGSFYLLDAVIKKGLPSVALPRRVLAIAVSAMYPAWLVMAGYAFSQGAFVFFFTASTLALFNWRPERSSSVLLHTALVGFLFWIHPTAVGVIAALTIVVALGSWMSGRYRSLLLHLALVLVLVIVYKLGLQVWMMKQMTPEGYDARGHYPSLAVILSSATGAKFWRDWFLVIFGQFAYLSIASLGAFVAGIFYLVKAVSSQVRGVPRDTSSREFGVAMLNIFLLVSMLGVIAITATSFASQAQGPGSLDEWFYGRYAEGVLLPLMAIGLAGWQRQGLTTGLTVAVAIVIIGVLIQSLSAEGVYLNLVNLQGFWPQSLLPQLSVASWFAVGAIAVAIYIMFFRVILLLPLAALFLLTAQTHLQWHENILLSYSRPSAMVDFVRKNFPKAQCVGFDPYLPPEANLQMAERIRLYSFYLFDSGFRRLDLSKWNQSCDGSLFSYDSTIIKSDAAMLVAIEPETDGCFFRRTKNFY